MRAHERYKSTDTTSISTDYRSKINVLALVSEQCCKTSVKWCQTHQIFVVSISVIIPDSSTEQTGEVGRIGKKEKSWESLHIKKTYTHNLGTHTHSCARAQTHMFVKYCILRKVKTRKKNVFFMLKMHRVA